MGLFGGGKYTVSRNEKSSIEPEEIFFDAKLRRSFDGENSLADSKMEVSLNFNNFLIIGIIILSAFCGMFFYNFYFQVFLSDKFSAQAKNNNTRIQSIKAPRGIVYDSNFNPLVSNEASFDVVLIPKDLPADKMDEYADKLSDIIGVSENELKTIFGSADRMSVLPVILKENLDKNSALLLETRIDNFIGIKVEKNAVRDYIGGVAFSHIIGYTAKISSGELKKMKGYLSTDYVGKTGVEQSYENYLKGENGEYVIYIDARHNILREGIEKESKIGNSLVLSIDSDIQKKAYELLSEAITGTELGGSLVAINSKNGQIIAAVSVPGYDNNLFSHGITLKNYQSLLNDKTKPLFNRIISGQYPPGSSIKPYIATAALEEKIISETRQILSTGSISIGNNPETAFIYRDWKEGGHGLVDIKKAIAQSVNTYFYMIGGGYGDIEGLGINRIKKYLELFGFNNFSGIDLAGEVSGFIPTPEWKKERLGENWYVGDNYNSSIGQGYISVTPIQVAVAVSTIANGGIFYKPRLVNKIVNSDKEVLKSFDSEIVRDDFIDKKNLEIIRSGMRQAVTDGSARSLNDLPIKVAGKTGTAQFGNENKTHAWFSGFAPYDDPEIALAILVEGGGEGSSVATPIAKEIFKLWADKHISAISN